MNGEEDGCSPLANVIDGQGKQICFCYTGLFSPETVALSVEKSQKGDLACTTGWGNGESSFLLAPSKGKGREPWGPESCG